MAIGDDFVAKSAAGFRGWFAVEVVGILRTGLVAGDFTVTIIAPNDGAKTTAAVTESAQLAGIYRFDVPSSFLQTNGVGQYMVVIVVNGGTPLVTDVETSLMGVTLQDLDSLAGAGLSTAQATALTEIRRLAGLDASKPLVVTATSRSAGAEISQTIVESPPGTVTVTRQ